MGSNAWKETLHCRFLQKWIVQGNDKALNCSSLVLGRCELNLVSSPENFLTQEPQPPFLTSRSNDFKTKWWKRGREKPEPSLSNWNFYLQLEQSGFNYLEEMGLRSGLSLSFLGSPLQNFGKDELTRKPWLLKNPSNFPKTSFQFRTKDSSSSFTVSVLLTHRHYVYWDPALSPLSPKLKVLTEMELKTRISVFYPKKSWKESLKVNPRLWKS